MTYISIDTNNKQALLFLEYAKTLPFVKVYEKPNIETSKAMDDSKKGKTKKFKNAEDLISSLAKEENNSDSYSWENALKFFKSHQVSFKNYKFNREEANAR